MGSSNENPKVKKFCDVNPIEFYANEERGIEVPPKIKEKAQGLKIEDARDSSKVMELPISEGIRTYTVENGIISFQEGKLEKEGKLVANDEFQKKLTQKQVKEKKASGEMTL